MTCAKPRTPPTLAYFDLEDHPLIIATWALTLLTTRKNKISFPILGETLLHGKICQPRKHSNKETQGTRKNTIFAELDGGTNSLVKSFIPSEIGCPKPPNLILSGPSRIPRELKHLRSIKVK